MVEPNTILQSRYRIIRQLGRGGMGAVFEAIDERVNRSVVLKKTFFDSQERLKDFKREAQLLANLRHPALPKVTDHFEESGGQYLVMDFIPGNDLAELIQLVGRPFPLADVLRWANELLRVLEYLHSFSPPILHRDIKPANLKLNKDGEIFLLDFGLAKGAAGQMSTLLPSAKSIPGYTANYSPLEQILKADKQASEYTSIDALSLNNKKEVERILQSQSSVRSDLYALGTTLYSLLTNEVPCNAVRRALYIWSGQQDPMRPAHEVNPLIPVEVSNVLVSATSLLEDQRPANAAAMRAALNDASLSTRLPVGQIALNQLSPQAIDSIVELTLERIRKQIDRKVAKNEADIARLADELSGLPQLVTSIVKTELTQHTAVRPEPAPAPKPPNTSEQVVTPPRRRYGQDEALPVTVEGEEALRLHRDARRFARLLVSEIKLFNANNVAAGMQSGDIYRRLKDYIDRSREMYDKRVKAEVSARWDYFDEEIIKTLASGDRGKMGVDYPGQRLAPAKASGV